MMYLYLHINAFNDFVYLAYDLLTSLEHYVR